ncbi:PD-(D/E)XK nuclease-like domain-containing protein [Macrococcus brunensis]|uniref:PD-(D/E)XK nuclease-like domain-containing protein n=1 Tax=Macrococcus brunensis TaxID=198483 RepID=UPI001EF07CDE|nr:PD-(D/E)XK nuclease-like domain-containing protein [Macrococcus brunensis]ULG72987.1 PD-(D/E)XK nuclease-like domain-containing protein [Macrococcus brunensis]
MNLNKENYYSPEANQLYMSVSLFKRFVQCEAAAMATLTGEYQQPTTPAMIVGNYVHSAFDSDEAFGEFVRQHSDVIYNRKGDLYRDYQVAQDMINTLKDDELAMFALDGEKEVILKGELFGQPWKCRIDSINHERKTFADIKTTQDLHKRIWSDKYSGWVSFVEAYDYVFQMYIYRELIHQNFDEYYEPYIVAVTKESPNNKAVISIDEERYTFEHDYAKLTMEDYILPLLSKERQPNRCERCEYCRKTKQLRLQGVIEVAELLAE